MDSVETQDGFWFKVDKNIRHYSSLFQRVARSGYWFLQPNHSCAPIFVVGCSRAGTTLVYKTLSQSSELGTLNRESHDLWAQRHPLPSRDWQSHGLSAADASEKDRAFISRYFFSHTGQRRFVDKNNQNGLCVSYLSKLFPNARFVYVKRNPGDNILSLMKGWERPGEYATWSDELPASVRIEQGVYSRWCFFLFEGWRDYLDAPLADVCAEQYRSMNQAILDTRSMVPKQQWIELKYEEILADPVSSFQAVFERCGLEFRAELRQHCDEVLSKPYNAFSKVGKGKWLNSSHQEAISEQLPKLQPMLDKMGYHSQSE